ncbi:NAD-dependent epimerase [Fretibacter rubidus]|uniref:NAD-dependent epimerase n=1 Tax=Fretibacter rubidus TaxID=570162 RepID=UPI003529FBB2
MTILVTGAAGFIGSFTTKALLSRGDTVVGLDNLNDYYDVSLKHARLESLRAHAEKSKGTFHFHEINIAESDPVNAIFAHYKPTRVINLAAQAGVRYSLINPNAYVQSNIVGFTNILEACRHNGVEHLVYASTSSVYGANTNMPFSENHNVDHPLQFYAATKRANELMAHSYSHLFGLPTTGLRFFTVYGPWGRPDMALFLFTKNILAGKPINVFNNGNHSRDFTYIDDIVEGIVRVIDRPASPDPDWSSDQPNTATSSAPYRIFNIGNNAPIILNDYIEAIEAALGIQAVRNLLPLQPGDVPDTYADSKALMAYTGYQPKTSVSDGVARFVEWYKNYYADELR